VMEYCPHDLFYHITSGYCTKADLSCYFVQLLRGLEYLHSSGIVHRDIKLENCVISPIGILKIIDFGCAEVVKAPWEKISRRCYGVRGSDPYIPPEVWVRDEIGAEIRRLRKQTAADDEIKSEHQEKTLSVDATALKKGKSHDNLRKSEHKPADDEYDGPLVDVWAAAIVHICMVKQSFPWTIARSTDRQYARYALTWLREHPEAQMDYTGVASMWKAQQTLPEYKRDDSKKPSVDYILQADDNVREMLAGMLTPDPLLRWDISKTLSCKWVQSVDVCTEAEKSERHDHKGCD